MQNIRSDEGVVFHRSELDWAGACLEMIGEPLRSEPLAPEMSEELFELTCDLHNMTSPYERQIVRNAVEIARRIFPEWSPEAIAFAVDSIPTCREDASDRLCRSVFGGQDA